MKKISKILLIFTCCTLMLTTINSYNNYPILPTNHFDYSEGAK